MSKRQKNMKKDYIKRCYFTEKHDEFENMKKNIIEFRNRINFLENKIKKLEQENEYIDLNNYILKEKK